MPQLWLIRAPKDLLWINYLERSFSLALSEARHNQLQGLNYKERLQPQIRLINGWFNLGFRDTQRNCSGGWCSDSTGWLIQIWRKVSKKHFWPLQDILYAEKDICDSSLQMASDAGSIFKTLNLGLIIYLFIRDIFRGLGKAGIWGLVTD